MEYGVCVYVGINYKLTCYLLKLKFYSACCMLRGNKLILVAILNFLAAILNFKIVDISATACLHVINNILSLKQSLLCQ